MKHSLPLLTTLLLAPLALLHAAELYVSANGNDSNPGTVERPLATLDKGAATARPGDTVCIKPGRLPLTL